MLPWQPPVCTGLGGEYNTVLFTEEFRFYVDFADKRLMFLELERMNFIPKTSFNVTAMVVVVS
jgi:hypothetical protein